MSTGLRSPPADRETLYRDWYELALHVTDANRPRAVAVAEAALAASDGGADLARVIAAANSALSATENAENPLEAPGSMVSPAPAAHQGFSMRKLGLLVGVSALGLLALIGIANVARPTGSHQTSSVRAARTTTRHSSATLDQAGPGNAAADKAAPADTAADKAAAARAAADKAAADKAPADKAAAARATYSSLLVIDLHQLSTATSLLEVSCAARDLGGCRNYAQSAHDLSLGFLRALNTVPVPPEYATADGLLRQALNQYILGTAMQVKGIDDLNPTELNAGSAMVTKGSSLIDQATSSLPAH